MTLIIPQDTDEEFTSIFPHNKDFAEGITERGVRAGQATIVVAKDGSGDAENIQEAIDMLTDDGGCIFIKEGTYTISSTINITKDNVFLLGCGTSSIIEAVGDIVAIDINGKSNIIIEKIKLNCDTGALWATQRGIKITNPNSININSVWITGGRYHAIEVAGTAGKVIITNCHIYSNSGMGIKCTAGDETIIGNNHIHDNGDVGVYLAPGENSTVVGNIITSNSATGITIHNADYNAVIGNRISEHTSEQIKISELGGGTSEKNVIVGNVLVSSVGVAITDGGTNTVSGNNSS